VEAQELGLERKLAELPEERSPVAKLLTAADVTRSPTGAAVPAEDRVADIVSRYGDAPPARAARLSAPALLALVGGVEHLLRLSHARSNVARSGEGRALQPAWLSSV
jgi:hypothetical protein